MRVGILWIAFLLQLQIVEGGEIYIDTKLPLRPIISIPLTQKEIKTLSTKVAADEFVPTLSLRLLLKEGPAAFPVSGKYEIVDSFLHFQPIHNLGFDLQFHITARIRGKENTHFYKTPEAAICDLEEASIIGLYPKPDLIPENQCFFHIQFDQPMDPSITAYRLVKILDEAGNEIVYPWRQRSYWLQNSTLLVMMIHPGRIKRGIDMEPVFEEGKSYTISVGSGFLSACGKFSSVGYEKYFRVGPADRTIPIALIDEIQLPNVDSKNPLRLPFSEQMDYASLQEGVTIMDSAEVEVNVYISFSNDNNILELIPLENWKAGNYKLILSKIVCDLANNRLNCPFEITDINEMKKDQSVIIEFTLE